MRMGLSLAPVACALVASASVFALSPATSWAHDPSDPPLTVADQPDRYAIPVDPHDDPSFQLGFLKLKQQIGEPMGTPLEDEHPPPDGGADMIQLTSTGLAAWTEGKLPAFTDGNRTWILSPATSPPTVDKTLSGATPTSPRNVAPLSIWDSLAGCESQGNWSISTGNGFSGGVQITPANWAHYGGTAYAPSAAAASRSAQIAIAQKIQADQGWKAWPACSRRLGLH